MVLEGKVTELAQQVLGGAYRVLIEAEGPGSAIEQALNDLSGVVTVKHPSTDIYEMEAGTDLRAEAARAVVSAGGKLRSLDLQESSLDEIYSRYFQEEEHVPAASNA
jgi:ABC-2 type transport system ATP-binding protein